MLKEHYVLGVGAGAFDYEMFDLGGFPKPQPAHNTLLGIMCELGVIGAGLFTGMIVATALWIKRLPPENRRLCGFLFFTWLAGGAMLSWEYQKVTWLVFGLLGAIGARAKGAKKY